MKALLYFLLAFVCVLAVGFNQVHAQSIAGANAQQGQDQFQGQTQSNALSNVGNSSVSFDNSFNGAEPVRSLPFPTAVEVDTGGGPQIFGRPDLQNYGPQYMSMANLVNALNHINLAEAKLDDESDIDIVAQLINTLDEDELAAARDADAAIRFELNNQADVMKQDVDIKPIAILSVSADDHDTMNSATLAVAIAKKAQELGGTRIILVNEGVVRRLSSWGVGIGLASNYATVGSDGQDVGSAGSGGTGWSWGEAQYFALPFLTAVIAR